MFAAARVTLRQHRFEVGAAALAALVLGVSALVVEYRLRALNVAPGCIDNWLARADGPDGAGACVGPMHAWGEILGVEGGLIFGAMKYLPFAVGLLGGVPIVARELEARTAQTAWSLSDSRLRWLIGQVAPIRVVLGVTVTFAALAAGLLEANREAWGEFTFHYLTHSSCVRGGWQRASRGSIGPSRSGQGASTTPSPRAGLGAISANAHSSASRRVTVAAWMRSASAGSGVGGLSAGTRRASSTPLRVRNRALVKPATLSTSSRIAYRVVRRSADTGTTSATRWPVSVANSRASVPPDRIESNVSYRAIRWRRLSIAACKTDVAMRPLVGSNSRKSPLEIASVKATVARTFGPGSENRNTQMLAV